MLARVDSLTEADVRELEKLAETYPYCQTAHVLLAKALHDRGSVLAGQKLRRAATGAPDRRVLRHLLQAPLTPPSTEIKPATPDLAITPSGTLVTHAPDSEAEQSDQQPPAATAPETEVAADFMAVVPTAAEIAPATAEVAETEVAETEVTETEAVEAEATETEVAETEVAEAEAAEAEVAETEVAETEAVEAEAVEAEVVEAEAAEAEVAETEVAEAKVAETEVTEAEAAETEVTETEVTETEVVEAEAAEAEVAEAEVTETEVAETKVAEAEVAEAEVAEAEVTEAEVAETDVATLAPLVAEFDPAPDPNSAAVELLLFASDEAPPAAAGLLPADGKRAREGRFPPLLPEPGVGYSMFSSRLGVELTAADFAPADLAHPWLAQAPPDARWPEHVAAHPAPAASPESPRTFEHQFALIDRFLREKPRLRNVDPTRPLPDKLPDLAQKSTRSDEGVISESMARILARQGKTARAVAMYELLQARLPEKAAIFAAQITALRAPGSSNAER